MIALLENNGDNDDDEDDRGDTDDGVVNTMTKIFLFPYFMHRYKSLELVSKSWRH